MFEVHNCRFSHGEVLPLLCRTPHQTPAALPLTYTVLRRRHRAVSTLRRDAQILKWFYQWAYHELGCDFDELAISGQLHLVLPWRCCRRFLPTFENYCSDFIEHNIDIGEVAVARS